MKLFTLPIRAAGVDTFEPLTDAQCKDVVADGCTFVVRYLDNLTPAELAMILGHGLACLFVHSSRDAGWIPSAAEGAADGQRDVKLLRALGVPAGVHVAFDLEGTGGTSGEVIAHVNEHGITVIKSDYLPMLYMGSGGKLTSSQLYGLVSVLYWHSCSYVADAAGNSALPQCGAALVQIYPPDLKLGVNGLIVDYNFAMSDFEGRRAVGVSA